MRDLRRSARFVVRDVRALIGNFASSEVTVVNFCDEGAMIAHHQPMRIGTCGRFTFCHGSVIGAAQAQIVWSHLLKTPVNGAPVYHSGLLVESHHEYVAAVRDLVAQQVVSPDDDSLDRKRRKLEQRERQKTAVNTLLPVRTAESPDQTLLIRHALTRLREQPDTIQRLSRKARESVAGAIVLDGMSDEVLALWEYLERLVDLRTIERVLREH